MIFERVPAAPRSWDRLVHSVILRSEAGMGRSIADAVVRALVV